jgi:hypothetical protein
MTGYDERINEADKFFKKSKRHKKILKLLKENSGLK